MDSTISVSKGCFVFKNGATRADKSAQTLSKRKRPPTVSTVLGKEVTEQPFYSAYIDTWQLLELEQLQQAKLVSTLDALVTYVAKEVAGAAETYGMDEIVPAAALLTGINQPDHFEQFESLAQRIQERVPASVCMLQSRDCSTLKQAVEAMVYNFVETGGNNLEDRSDKRLRRSQCTMKQLMHWYRNNYPNCSQIERLSTESDDVDGEDDALEVRSAKCRHALVVILPDFVCFNSIVLQDFILILSSHCTQLPFLLILGVATAVSAVHNTLSYHVASKIKLRVFQTTPAPASLNEILERVILSPKNPFHLSGRAFKFLTHIFLYYDFSINGFIQGYKYCLMEHYFRGSAYALCCGYSASLAKIKTMTHDDIETIRRMLSFRPYVERINDCKRIIAILTDDDYLKKKLPQLLRDCHVHFMLLRIFIEFLAYLVTDLPKFPLGQHRREIYATCLSKELTEQAEFNECWHMLSFMSKDELVSKISEAVKATQNFCEVEVSQLELAADCAAVVTAKLQAVKELLTKVVMAGMESAHPPSQRAQSTTSPEQFQHLSSRQELKEKLLQLSKQQMPTTEYAKAVNETLTYIRLEIIEKYLTPLQRAPPLHELFVFSDVGAVRRNIIGAPRAALHMALNNPHFYLQCKCCQLAEQTQLLPTLPDLSVAYKLHLECGRMINLFDWLQAFRAVVDSSEDGREQVDPQIQARFTRAVAELQFLGYIKMSKRKTDHATRLTW